jgi:hypothetical protein
MKLRPGLTKAIINKWVGLACRGRTVVEQATLDPKCKDSNPDTTGTKRN